MILAWRNLIDEAVLYPRSEDIAGLPRANLQSTMLERVWRHTTLAGAVAEFDMSGSSEPVQLVALLNHNLSRGNTEAAITKYASYTPATQTGTVDQTTGIDTPPTDPGPRHHFAIWPDEADTGAYMVADLAETGHPDGYIQAGRLWAGPMIRFDASWSLEYDDTGSMPTSKRGVGFLGTGVTYRKLNMAIGPKSQTETWGSDGAINDIANVVEQIDAMYAGQEVIAIPADHDNYLIQRTGIYGVLSGRPLIQPLDIGVYRVSLAIEEVR